MAGLLKGVLKAADRLSGKIPESGPELVAYMTRKDLETKPDGRKTWKSWNNYTLTQLARELAKESRYTRYQKKECYEQLIHRLLDFRFFAHMLKAIMVVEEELLLDFREAAYVLQLFKDSEIPPHIIEKEVQHPRFKERLQRKDKITLKDLIAHLQNVNYKIWVDDHQEDWGHAIRKRARRIYKYLDDPEELAIARAKAQGKPIPQRQRSRAKPQKSAKSSSSSKKSSKSSSRNVNSSSSSSKKKSSSSSKPKTAKKPAAQPKSKPKAAAKKEDGFDDIFGAPFGGQGGASGGQTAQQVAAHEDPSMGWLASMDSSNLNDMGGFAVETGDGGGVEFGFGNFDDEKNDEMDDEDDDENYGDEDFENMFSKLAKTQNANILDAQQKKPSNLKNTKGKTMAQMASQKQYSDLNEAMKPTDFTQVKDPFAPVSSDPFADMNNQAAQQQAQVNTAFSGFGNVGGGMNGGMGGGYGGGMGNGMGNGMGGGGMNNGFGNNMGGGYGGGAMNNNMNNNNNRGGVTGSPADLFSVSASQNPSSIFAPNDPFANLSAQYTKQGNNAINSNLSYGNRNKPKDAFSDLSVLK